MNHALTLRMLLGVASGAASGVTLALGLQMVSPNSGTDSMGLGCIALIIGIALLALSVWGLS